MADKTSAVLDSMVADVVNRKRAPRTPQEPANGASGTQTPPPGRNGQAAPELGGSVAQAQAALLDYLATMEAHIDGLKHEVSNFRFAVDLMLSPIRLPEVITPESIEEARKKAEAEADQRSFERSMKAKEEAAQTATFSAPEPAPESNKTGAPSEPDGWVCPDHAKSSWKTSPKGRQYLACPVKDCGEFERQR
jgi:hypothetical protein